MPPRPSHTPFFDPIDPSGLLGARGPARSSSRRPHPGAATAGVLTALAITLAAWAQRAFTPHCDGVEACVTIAEIEGGAPLPEAIEILDRHGETLAEVAGPLRRSLGPDEIPTLVRDAFVAVEDRRFWEHEGVDPRGVVRAAIRNVRAGSVEEGASTIPMQLVRTLWSESLRGSGPWRRKVVEAFTAPRLVARLGHRRVLDLYLNSIYLGNGIHGIERAARHYFGRSVDELDLAEVATLVGMTKAPERYEPRRHPERARARRDVVLGILAAEGLVPPEAATRAASEPVRTIPDPGLRRERSYLTAAVTRELRAVAPALAGRPGIRVHTGIDPDLQAAGGRALAAQLEAVDRRIEDGAGRPIEDERAPLQGSAVALDPATGTVRAWIGGRRFADSEFDRVDQAHRQVGSLVKPFLVAAALERGVGILSPVRADTVPIRAATGPWLPADHVAESVLPLREALVRSSNRAAAHLSVDLGLEVLGNVARRAGIDSPVPALPSSSIGAFDASLLEMVGAYAVFGNGGYAVEPHLILKIEGPSGAPLWTRAPSPPIEERRVLDRQTSFVVLDALRDVVDRGTAFSVRATGYRGVAAGKTGTTNEGRDGWFVGLTPDVVAGVWVGFDQPRTIVSGAGGGALAAPAWSRWMSEARSSGVLGARSWLPPIGLELVRYDPVTGQALGRGCPAHSGADPAEAWVRSTDVSVRECRKGVLGWLQRAWSVISPPSVEPVEPVRIPSGERGTPRPLGEGG